jgi:hypothetical protein
MAARNDKSYAALAQRYRDRVFIRDHEAWFWTSTCAHDPVHRLVVSPAQMKKLRDAEIVSFCKDKLTAESTWTRKSAIAAATVFGLGERAIGYLLSKHGISSILRSST